MSRLETWERRSEWPLAAAALAFLVACTIPILYPEISPSAARTLSLIALLVWVVFAVDYLARLRLATDRRAFVRGNLVDLAIIEGPGHRGRLIGGDKPRHAGAGSGGRPAASRTPRGTSRT